MKRHPSSLKKGTALIISVHFDDGQADREPKTIGRIRLEGSSWEDVTTGAQMHVVNVLEALVDSLQEDEYFSVFS